MNPPQEYTVFTDKNEHTVEGRANAVEKAKEISSVTWREVRLERHDKRVQMQFRRGSLQTYRYESRHRRR